jgi:ATP-binding protein involved in chromosome partitioning
VLVTTPQDVSLADTRRGISMFRKLNIPVCDFSVFLSRYLTRTAIKLTGMILNNAYYLCPTCTHPSPQYIFGPPDSFQSTADALSLPVLAHLPLVPGVSSSGDRGVPYVLHASHTPQADGSGGKEWYERVQDVANRVWREVQVTADTRRKSEDNVG